MPDYQSVWIDTEACTGCGACVDVCPEGALAMVNQVAQVDEEACTGCGACLDICPHGAIHPVVEGEIVLAQERALKVENTKDLAPAMDRYRPLIESTAPALAVAGAGLLAKAARALTSAVGRWLTSPPGESQPTQAATSTERGIERAGNGGRRTRRRRRGR